MTRKNTVISAFVIYLALGGIIILAISPDAMAIVLGAAIGLIASVPIIVIMVTSRRAASRQPARGRPSIDATWSYLDPSDLPNPSDPRQDRTQTKP